MEKIMKTRSLFTFLVLTVLLAACAPAASTPAAPAAAAAGAQVKVDISNFAFNPGSVTIKVGETVTWTNNDSASHNVKADDGSFASSTLGNGASFSYTFNTAGTFTYKCGFHAKMTGTVIVQP
jgi:plastocyanin